MKKKYIHRHKILLTLQASFDKNYRPDAQNSSEYDLSWSELSEKSGLNDDELKKQIYFLMKSEEVFDNETNYSSSYLILHEGTKSLFDEKYLNIGRKEFKDNLFDWLKIVSGFVLLLIAIITFGMNLFLTSKNNKEIETMKSEIKIIKESAKKKK
ncbi:hypothetical protein WG904_12470 [Pedobacter sp. Du54]|uniref:hypothetical protein n=1 Tax=Pedobacter anseongensis TaxID=3133439 RepID=UPI0030AD7F70